MHIIVYTYMTARKNIDYTKFTKELLEIEYRKHGTLKATALANGVSSSFIKRKIVEYNISYKKKIKYTCDEDFFSRDSEKSFYWAGFMAADGNISKQNDLLISVAEKDKEHLFKFKSDIKTDSPVRQHQKEKIINICGQKESLSTNQYKIRFRSAKIANDLKRFNIVPNKTKVYSLPDWLLQHNLFKHFIRGYFDGDGWYSKSKISKGFRMSFGLCGNKSVLELIRNYLNRTLNLTSVGSLHIRKNGLSIISYANQHDVLTISNYLYGSALIYLDRKYNLSKQAKISDKQTIILNIDENKLRYLYDNLRSGKLVAKELGCSNGAIYKYLKKYNIKTNPTRQGERVRNIKRLNLDKHELITLYTKYGNINKIAIHMNRSPTTIKKYLLEYDIL